MAQSHDDPIVARSEIVTLHWEGPPAAVPPPEHRFPDSPEEERAALEAEEAALRRELPETMLGRAVEGGGIGAPSALQKVSDVMLGRPETLKAMATAIEKAAAGSAYARQALGASVGAAGPSGLLAEHRQSRAEEFHRRLVVIPAVLRARGAHAACVELDPTVEHFLDAVERLGVIGRCCFVRPLLDDVADGDNLCLFQFLINSGVGVPDAAHPDNTYPQ